MRNFFKRLRGQPPTEKKIYTQIGDNFQRHLDVYNKKVDEEVNSGMVVKEVSVKQLESETDGWLKQFQLYVKRIKDTTLRLEELRKLRDSNEITENAFNMISDELYEVLAYSVENVFKVREILEVSRARARVEWAKERIGIRETLQERDLVVHEIQSSKLVANGIHHAPLRRVEGLISNIDSALSTLQLEEEASIIEQYLILAKGRTNARKEETEKGILLCQQRLTSISDRWTFIRRGQVEQIMNHNSEASQVREEIKELQARFTVGELGQGNFEEQMSDAQRTLRKVEKEISSTRKAVDDMDMKIFRCSELLRGNP